MKTRIANYLAATVIILLACACAEDQRPSVDIWTAAATGNTAAVREHVNYGTDLDSREQMGGSTPLIVAALYGQTGVAKLLVENGATLDETNNDGSTALHTAAFFCHPDTVTYLLEQGASVDIRNNFGSTPLDAVAGEWSPEIEQFYTMLDQALQLDLDLDAIRQKRPQIAALIREHSES